MLSTGGKGFDEARGMLKAMSRDTEPEREVEIVC
jgi:hypothetical protein